MSTLPMEGEFDEVTRSHVVRVTEEWIVSIIPMIFNDRVVLTGHHEYPYTYTAGWCYDKGAAAYFAAAIWDPEVDESPRGWKKIACDARPGAADRAQARREAEQRGQVA